MKKSNLFIPALIAVPLIVCVVMLRIYLSYSNELTGLTQQQKEMQVLKVEYQSLKNVVDAVESKKSLTNIQGVVQAVDEISVSLGLKGRVKSVKSSGAREIRNTVEEDADIQIDKLNMNELVNLLYKIENAPMALSLKRVNIRTSFDDPSLLNISMTLSLIRNK